MTEKTKNILSAFVAWLVAAWVFFFTRNIKSGAGGLIKPQFIPRVVAVLLIVIGIVLFISGLRYRVSDNEKENNKKEKESKKDIPIIERLTPLLTLILIFFFLFLMKPLGFTITATIYLTLQMTLLSGDFSWKSWLKYFIIALVASIAIFFIFRYGFKLKLPINKWKF